MPVAKQKKLHPTQVKRHGLHHKQGHHYVKIYWPYLPLLAISVLGSALLYIGSHHERPSVLAYATEMSTTSLLNATNQQRQTNGRQPLTLNSQLAKAAQAKANDMARRNYWAHNTPDGVEPWAFIQNTGYAYQKAGENLAYGFPTSSDAVSGWMNSPGHRANLLDSAFKDVGFGFANMPDYQNNGPETIVVAEYGNPLTVAYSGQAGNQSPVFSSTDQNTPVTSNQATLNNQTTAISRLQNWSHGSLPAWVSFVVGLTGGVALTYLLLKHSLGLRKLIVQGETLFLHHPYIDSMLLAIVFVSLFLNQTTGFIR